MVDKLKEKQLDLLIALTGIRSESVVRALHLHLVEGKPQYEAAEIVGVSQALISKRTKAIREAEVLARKLSNYYLFERLLPLIDLELLTEFFEQR